MQLPHDPKETLGAKIILASFIYATELITLVYGRFDTKSFRYKSFRYKSKSFRYTCKVVSIHI